MLTYDEAMTCGMFYHAIYRNRDGSAVRARRNGKTQTWKRTPGEFSIPVKYGFKECFRIEGFSGPVRDPINWLPVDPTDHDMVRRFAFGSENLEAAHFAVYDRLVEMGRLDIAEAYLQRYQSAVGLASPK